MARIEAFYKSRREHESVVNRFLSYRCDPDFLAGFIVRNPSFVSSLRVGSYLYAVSDVDVIVRLHEFGLLPENIRLATVAAIRDLAVETPDAGFLRDEIRQLLTSQELNDVLDHVRTTLLPSIDDQIDNWRANYNGDDDPEDYFSELKSALREYREVLEDDESAVEEIDAALASIDDVIEGLRSDMPQEPNLNDFYSKTTSGNGHDESRSIFDDVDH